MARLDRVELAQQRLRDGRVAHDGRGRLTDRA
jgi:hypothetical protein